MEREAIRAGAYLHPSSKIELLLASKIRSPMREAMPIRTLLNDDQSFSPEEAKVLVEAFEQSLKALRLVDREDPATLLVAEKVLEAPEEASATRSGYGPGCLLNSGRHRHSCWGRHLETCFPVSFRMREVACQHRHPRHR